MKPGVRVEQASAELDGLGKQLEESYPLTNRGMGFQLVSINEFLLGNVRVPLYLLLGAVTFVLLIATANVANLMLARSAARDKEVAIRSALGAGGGTEVLRVLGDAVRVGMRHRGRRRHRGGERPTPAAGLHLGGRTRHGR